MYATIQEQLLSGFHHDPLIARRIKDIEKRVMEGGMTPYQGATRLIGEYVMIRQSPGRHRSR
jgi:hypothetical protein